MNKIITLIAVAIALSVGWLFFVNQGPNTLTPKDTVPTTEDGALEDEIVSVVEDEITLEEISQ